MKQEPSLEDIQTELEAQNAAFAEAAKLAQSIPPGVSVPESILHEFDEAMTPRPGNGLAPNPGIRA